MPDGTLFNLPAVLRVRRPRRRKDSAPCPGPLAGVGNSVPPRMARLLAACNAPVALTVAAE